MSLRVHDYQIIFESPEVPDHAYESQSPIDTDHDQQPNPAELQRSTRERNPISMAKNTATYARFQNLIKKLLLGQTKK